MKSMRSTLTALCAAAALGACAPAAEQALNNTPLNTKTQLVVENSNWADIDVYLVRSGVPQRLGTVESMRSATFRIPDAYIMGVSDIQVAARPVGSNEQYLSSEIQVFPGQHIDLQLQNVLRMSYFSVRSDALR